MPKVIIIFEDDWELWGNGLGNVAHLQYLPLLYLIGLANKFEIKINFMVEVLQQLAFIKYSSGNRNLSIQSNLWDECIILMKENGHDVQLHLHPQWYNCTYRDGFFKLNNDWNISNYEPNDRQSMISSSIIYLENLLKKIDQNYRVMAFKAESWAMQPSQGILSDIENSGIRIVIAGGRGIRKITNYINIDYTDIEQDTLPYYPDFADICKVSDKKENIIVIPLPYYKSYFNIVIIFLIQYIINKIKYHNKMFYYINTPPQFISISPFAEKRSIINKIISLFDDANFDISSLPPSVMKSAFDQIISRVLNYGLENIPVVLQSHSKGYFGNYDQITKFIDYITNRYHNYIKFMTFTELYPLLSDVTVKG